jgi:hypothetical protein
MKTRKRAKKLLVQIVLCLVLSAGAFFGGNTGNETFDGYYARAREMVMTPLTAEDVVKAGRQVQTVLAGAPAKVVSAAIAVSSASQYAAPIDEGGGEQIKQVHAAAGGMVVESGKNDTLGLYIKIRHEHAITTYGNLADISVIQAERVQRGEIIGSYDSLCGEEFYYDLQEDL